MKYFQFKKPTSILQRILFLILISINTGYAQENSSKLGNQKLGWQISIDNNSGAISTYQTYQNGEWKEISFRKDRFAGPVWKDVQLSVKDKSQLLFEGQKEGILYSICYLNKDGHLVVRAGICNLTEKTFAPESARIILGINAEMNTYPEWDNRYFPTLLRCEKTHCWGYFMSPLGRIMAFGVSEPVASYTMNYIYEGSWEWNSGHQIYTASLDLLHQLPLPLRHPQNQTSLAPGESRYWNIHLGEINTLDDLKSILSKWIQVPMIEAERYSLLPGEKTSLTINSPEKVKIQLIDPQGKILPIQKKQLSAEKYTFTFNPTTDAATGLYTVKVISVKSRKISEATINVQEPFSWYMKMARNNAYRLKPIVSGSAESSYGFYAAFLARKYFPDEEKDQYLEQLFNDKISLAFDLEKGKPLPEVSAWRVQNISTVIGLYTDLWEATRDTSYLMQAAKFGDYIASSEVQKEDGSYRSGKTHYTAVIYPAKSMLELASAEKELSAYSKWNQYYNRHLESAQRAIKDLQKRLDNIETEGDLTFEDGMITCSALQLGLGALETKDSEAKEKYTKAAAYMMKKHLCLEQNLIPDARMSGATLRFWEALDLYLVPNQIMCSPHGWTAWKIYADYYLYLLSGEEKYLRDCMNTLGACLQVIDKKGELRWGFFPDPYIKALQFIQDSPGSIKGKKEEIVIGEQYMPMITGWFRPADENKIVHFGQQGGSGDNTVYEIFKALEECALNKAYVIQEKDGTLKTWNCSARYDHGRIIITPAEIVVERIHFNLIKHTKIIIKLGDNTINAMIPQGLSWVSKSGIETY